MKREKEDNEARYEDQLAQFKQSLMRGSCNLATELMRTFKGIQPDQMSSPAESNAGDRTPDKPQRPGGMAASKVPLSQLSMDQHHQTWASIGEFASR